jgi:hypothetical protein
MNGVYVRRNPPRFKKRADQLPIALYYEHEDGVWHMVLNELPGATEEEEEEEDDYAYLYNYRPKKKKPTHEWMFTDEFGNDRFSHEGDTIVPGAGVRWKHVHKKTDVPPPTETAKAKAERQLESWLSPYENHEEFDGGAAASGAVTEIKEDDEDELPWQVIAILDIETVQQLLWSSQHRKDKVLQAKAGKNVPAPSRSSLEGMFSAGRWLFRVVAPEGVVLRMEAADDSEELGRRSVGEYVRGVELSVGGEWLRLDSAEDNAPRRGGSSRYYNAEFARKQVWVRVQEGSGEASPVPGNSSKGSGRSGSMPRQYLEEVPAEETAVLELKGVGDLYDDEQEAAGGAAAPAAAGGDTAVAARAKEAAGGDGLTGDLFDKPFVPRMEDASEACAQTAAEAAALLSSIKSGEQDPSMQAIQAAATAATQAVVPVPVGAAVQITGLRSRSGAQYNGVTGVVMGPIDGETGRQGVRLDAPFRYSYVTNDYFHIVVCCSSFVFAFFLFNYQWHLFIDC